MAYNLQSTTRPLSEEEKFNVNELGPGKNANILNLFLAQLADVSVKYQKQLKPFDSYNARIDFDTKMRDKTEEMYKTVDIKKFNPNIEFGDLNKYSDPDRFEYVKKTEVISARLVLGMKQEVHIGYRFHFRGKQRGNRISIFVPDTKVEKMDSWIEENYDIKPEEVETSVSIVDEVPKAALDKRVNEPDVKDLEYSAN